MSELPKGPVKIVVGAVIGVGLLAAFYSLLGLGWWLFVTALLLVEAWSFFNPYANDTISEVIWGLSERPLVPLLFGSAAAWAITSGVIPVTQEGLWITLSMGTLLGHFFWQRKGDVESAQNAADVAVNRLDAVKADKVEVAENRLSIAENRLEAAQEDANPPSVKKEKK